MKFTFGSPDNENYTAPLVKSKKAGLIGIIIAVIAIIAAVIVGLLFLSGGCQNKQQSQQNTPNTQNQSSTSSFSKEENKVELYDCFSNSTSELKKVPGIINDLYFAKLDKIRSSEKKISPVPLSLKDYVDEESHPIKDYLNPPETTLKNDIFFELKKEDGGYMHGYAGFLQLCNSENKSNSIFPPLPNGFTPISENGTGALYYIHGGYEPPKPRIYRVDGYLYTPDGKWQLVARLENVEFTE